MTRDVENDNSNTDWQTFWKLKQMSLVASDVFDLTETTSLYSTSSSGACSSAIFRSQNMRNALLEHCRRFRAALNSTPFRLLTALILSQLLVASLLALFETRQQLDHDASIAEATLHRRDQILQRIAGLHFELDQQDIHYFTWVNKSLDLLDWYEQLLLETNPNPHAGYVCFSQMFLLVLASISTTGFKLPAPRTLTGKVLLAIWFVPGLFLFFRTAIDYGTALYALLLRIFPLLHIQSDFRLVAALSTGFSVLIFLATVLLTRLTLCDSIVEAMEMNIYSWLLIGTGHKLDQSKNAVKGFFICVAFLSVVMFSFLTQVLLSCRAEIFNRLKAALAIQLKNSPGLLLHDDTWLPRLFQQSVKYKILLSLLDQRDRKELRCIWFRLCNSTDQDAQTELLLSEATTQTVDQRKVSNDSGIENSCAKASTS
ncbi:hypothetical protein T11_13426 [Trichinella zimbabwensis]|uniref:Uncharacterized protein n=1 Tax=Trichinella zimbabwensis TaxID=268475 RepID=A0A0V1H0M1_9BILA|nr:hypothetical protein T11_13426 [Trichinella zimbabwensis]